MILERSWIDDWYRITFEGRSPTRLIQFTTDWDATYQRILFYNQLYVGHDFYPAERSSSTETQPLYRSFVSQTQPGIEDPGEDLILNGRWQNQRGDWCTVKPYPYGFGLGVELAPDLSPATHTIIDPQGAVRTPPNHGLIIMPSWTFWESLAEYTDQQSITDLTQHAFKVTRSGARFKHRFRFEAISPATALNLPDVTQIDLHQVMNQLVSEARLEAHINHLPTGHCFRR